MPAAASRPIDHQSKCTKCPFYRSPVIMRQTAVAFFTRWYIYHIRRHCQKACKVCVVFAEGNRVRNNLDTLVYTIHLRQTVAEMSRVYGVINYLKSLIRNKSNTDRIEISTVRKWCSMKKIFIRKNLTADLTRFHKVRIITFLWK